MARIGPELPDGPLVSFGLCGALVDGLPPGTIVTARSVVDEAGEALWEGPPRAVAGARAVVLCAAGRIVDAAGERTALAERSGAEVVDLESGRLAATGRLAGVVLNRASAADILHSEFSSSARSMSADPLEQQSMKLAAADHRGLQLGPIGRAVIAVSDLHPNGPSPRSSSDSLSPENS